MKKNLLPILVFLAFTASLCKAQTPILQTTNSNPVSTGWTITHPFEHKVFIENKGQFTDDEKKYINKPILFYNRLGKIQLYFSASSITFCYDSIIKTEDDDANQNKSNDPDQVKNVTAIPQFLTMTWQNANSNVDVEVQEPESDYFTYSDPSDKSRHSGIIAHAWQKLIYHNLYKGIDVEFYYPADREGIEYNIIVHPGADLSQVQMAYSGNAQIAMSGNDAGISYGGINLVDHAPLAKDGNGNSVSTSFSVNDNIVSFKTANYDKTQTLTIDPWVTDPKFFVYDVAYDVNYDNAGNVYIGGGLAPYELQKYDSSGARIWSYSLVSINPGSMNYWGDFTVDVRNGTSYAVRGLGGYNNYLNAVKVNSAGTPLVIDSDPSGIYAELWRVAFDYTNNQLVCAGGEYYPVTLMDTNLTSIKHITMMDSMPPFIEAHDMFLLSLDGNGNAYMATDESSFAQDTIDNNYLFKMSLPNCTPIKFRSKDNYKFVELISLFYYPVQPNGSYGYANGFNGIASNKSMVVTYDGATLKKWGASKGILKNSVNVSGTSFQWGGLDLDCEGDVYVGNNSSINVYDSSLNFLNSMPLNNTVFSLKVGNGRVYACGYEFVQAVNLIVNPYPTIIATPNPASFCGGVGPVITATGGINYTWSPSTGLSATTGSSVTASPTVATTYTITGTNANGCTGTTTVVVGPITINVSAPNAICDGDSATLAASGATSYVWTPSTGLNITTGDSVIAKPIVTTTYTVIGTNNGCVDTLQVVIKVNSGINKPILTQQGNVLTSSATEGNQWYKNDTIISGATNESYTVTETGCYWSIATNIANGCSTTSDTICINTLSGIKQVSAINNQLSIYPNPTGGEIFINISSSVADVKDWDLQITDVLGRTMYLKPSLNYKNDIDLSNLSSGVYFITVINKTEREVTPVVKL